MLIWTVANQKGGVGKTTTSIALGGLYAEQGRRVLLLDLDPHGSLSSYFKFDPDQVQAGVFTLFQQRKDLSRELLRSTVNRSGFDRLDMVASSPALATLERHMTNQDGMGLVISRSLALLADDYDLAIIDCPPILGVLMINALAACQHLVIPVQTEFLAIKGLQRMTHTLDMMHKSRHRKLDYSIVPTMFDRRTSASTSSLVHLRNNFDEQVWRGRVPVDTKLRDASRAGVPPGLFDPNGRSVEAYRSLLKWLLERSACESAPTPRRAVP